MKKLVLLFAALLVAGCGEKSSSEGSESASEKPTAPSEEVKPVEEKQQEVEPEEPVAETKPTEEASVSPHLKYETEGDAVTITGRDKKASGALTIPATIEGKTVTSIGFAAIAECRSLTSVTIGAGVTSIGNYAFSECRSLTSVTIGAGVTSIGNGALYGCKSLAAVTFLGDAPKVEDMVFNFTKKSCTIYRKPEAKGWGDTFAGRPVKLISEKP